MFKWTLLIVLVALALNTVPSSAVSRWSRREVLKHKVPVHLTRHKNQKTYDEATAKLAILANGKEDNPSKKDTQKVIDKMIKEESWEESGLNFRIVLLKNLPDPEFRRVFRKALAFSEGVKNRLQDKVHLLNKRQYSNQLGYGGYGMGHGYGIGYGR